MNETEYCITKVDLTFFHITFEKIPPIMIDESYYFSIDDQFSITIWVT